MKNRQKDQRQITNPLWTIRAGVVLLVIVLAGHSSFAYERYKNVAEDPLSNCSLCHGDFDGNKSTKGSVFPGGDKHAMHRDSGSMNADCDLCHTSGDSRNPYLGSSNGTANNPGLGCNGCHNAVGLRAHHAVNDVEISPGVTCYTCHTTDGTPPAENVLPHATNTYYGVSADSNVDNPCNDVAVANMNENWTIGDFIGTDNDGDNLYDLADFDCGPAYQITAMEIEGGNVRITWDSVGGRRDMLQSTGSLTEPFADVGSALDIPGVGILSTNSVEVSGVTASNRFYRIRYAPAL